MRSLAVFLGALFLTGAVCVIAGVALLVGLAWALIAGGLFLFVAAYFIRAGLTPNA